MASVEVAAAKRRDGPTPEDLEAIRAATSRSRRSTSASGSPTTTSAAFVDVLAAAPGGGRWIHYGLTSSDVLDTALALQLAGAAS